MAQSASPVPNPPPHLRCCWLLKVRQTLVKNFSLFTQNQLSEAENKQFLRKWESKKEKAHYYTCSERRGRSMPSSVDNNPSAAGLRCWTAAPFLAELKNWAPWTHIIPIAHLAFVANHASTKLWGSIFYMRISSKHSFHTYTLCTGWAKWNRFWKWLSPACL